jgi:hypothetical protein
LNEKEFREVPEAKTILYFSFTCNSWSCDNIASSPIHAKMETNTIAIIIRDPIFILHPGSQGHCTNLDLYQVPVNKPKAMDFVHSAFLSPNDNNYV